MIAINLESDSTSANLHENAADTPLDYECSVRLLLSVYGRTQGLRLLRLGRSFVLLSSYIHEDKRVKIAEKKMLKIRLLKHKYKDDEEHLRYKNYTKKNFSTVLTNS